MLDVVRHLTLLVHEQVIVQFLVMRGYTRIATGLLRDLRVVVILVGHRAYLPGIIAG